MAKTKPAAAVAEVIDHPDEVTLAADHKAAVDNVNALKAALAEAEAEAAKTGEALAAVDAPEPITGPRIKLEETGVIVPVEEGQQRERRLLYSGDNYEHVSDVIDQGETIWVYRRM